MKEPMIWYRTLEGVVPQNVKAEEFFERMQPGELFEMEAKATRNLRHSRKWWKLIQIVVDNHDDYDTKEEFRYALFATMHRGKWVEVKDASRALFIPDSISFKSMDQTEFDKFYNESINAVLRWFIPFDREDLERELATS